MTPYFVILSSTAKDKINQESNFSPFGKFYQFYCNDQCTYPCFPGFFFTGTLHNTFCKLLAALTRRLTIFETITGDEKRKNPIARTIINRLRQKLTEPGIQTSEPQCLTTCSQPTRPCQDSKGREL